MRNRIDAIGTLYRTLSRTAAVDSVRADEYLSEIIREAVTALEISPGAIDLDLSIDDISLSTRIAVPLGLITNELATNSLKYAYKGRDKGILGFRVVTDKDGIEITIWDDGPGIDESAHVDSGLGQKLIEAFVQQLGGALIRTSGKDGTRHILAVPHSEIFQVPAKQR